MAARMEDLRDTKVTPMPTSSCDFQIGDHVYQWCSFVGIPAVFQHHGIVLDCYYSDGDWKMQVIDFSKIVDDRRLSETESQIPEGNIDPSFSARRKNSKKLSFGSVSTQGYGIRSYEVSLSEEQWHRVDYQASWWKRQFHRSGTCTAAPSDPPGLVRARAQFLLEHPEYLPPYDAAAANCECVAVWCKTGTWATLQAVNWLVVTAAGQVKSAVTVGSIAAATQVTVTAPAAGFWGWMGYTSTAQVSLLSTQPYLLPAIIGYGVVTVAAPTLWLLRSKHLAKQTTERLNIAFWEQAIDQPEVFVECITNWSTLYELKDQESKDLSTSNSSALTQEGPISFAPDDGAILSPSNAPEQATNNVDLKLSNTQDEHVPLVVEETSNEILGGAIVSPADAQEEADIRLDPEAHAILNSVHEQSAGQHSVEESS